MKDEAYQKAQAIIIRHVDCDVSDVHAVQLVAEAILEAVASERDRCIEIVEKAAWSADHGKIIKRMLG